MQMILDFIKTKESVLWFALADEQTLYNAHPFINITSDFVGNRHAASEKAHVGPASFPVGNGRKQQRLRGESSTWHSWNLEQILQSHPFSVLDSRVM